MPRLASYPETQTAHPDSQTDAQRAPHTRCLNPGTLPGTVLGDAILRGACRTWFTSALSLPAMAVQGQSSHTYSSGSVARRLTQIWHGNHAALQYKDQEMPQRALSVGWKELAIIRLHYAGSAIAAGWCETRCTVCMVLAHISKHARNDQHPRSVQKRRRPRATGGRWLVVRYLCGTFAPSLLRFFRGRVFLRYLGLIGSQDESEAVPASQRRMEG